MKIRTLIGVRQVENEMGKKMTLAYYLTEETRDQLQGGAIYGAGIVKQSKEGEESEWLEGLTCARGQMEELLSRMMRGAVTPVSMAAVADDFLAECTEP